MNALRSRVATSSLPVQLVWSAVVIQDWFLTFALCLVFYNGTNVFRGTPVAWLLQQTAVLYGVQHTRSSILLLYSCCIIPVTAVQQ